MRIAAIRRWIAGLGRRPLVLSGVALCVATGTALAMALTAGVPAVVHAVHRFHPEWIAVIAGGRALCYVGYTLAYRTTMCMRGGPRLSFRQSLSLVSAGFGVFVVGGGFAVDRRALRGLGASREQARIRVLGLGALEYAGLAPVAWICALLLLDEPRVHESLTIPWAVGVPVGAIIAIWLAFWRHRTRIGAWLRHAGRHGVAAVEMVGEIVTPGRGHYLAWLGIVGYWVGELLSTWAGLRLFGLHLSVPKLVLAYATGYAVTPRGLPLAGVGITEVLMPLAYTWVGLPLAPAVLAVFAYRLVTLLMGLPPALIARPRIERIRVERPGPPGTRRSGIAMTSATAH